jgi:hypothetical protein
MPVPPDITLRAPDGTPYSAPLGSSRFYFENGRRVILIHGFRNSESEALETYELFQSYLASFGPQLSFQIYSLVWPGDYFGGNPIRYFDDNVQNALACGKTLGRFLHDLIVRQTADREFVIVAHSLGCRVTAEMMQELYRLNPNACSRFTLVLMAGAVPVSDIQDNASYGTSLAAVGYVANLFSPADKVLRWLFPPGEYGGGRHDPEPIGLNGAPSTFAWTVRQQMTGFDHGDYWRKLPTAEFVARVLGIPVPNVLATNEPPSFHPPEFVPG